MEESQTTVEEDADDLADAAEAWQRFQADPKSRPLEELLKELEV